MIVLSSKAATYLYRPIVIGGGVTVRPRTPGYFPYYYSDVSKTTNGVRQFSCSWLLLDCTQTSGQRSVAEIGVNVKVTCQAGASPAGHWRLCLPSRRRDTVRGCGSVNDLVCVAGSPSVKAL